MSIVIYAMLMRTDEKTETAVRITLTKWYACEHACRESTDPGADKSVYPPFTCFEGFFSFHSHLFSFLFFCFCFVLAFFFLLSSVTYNNYNLSLICITKSRWVGPCNSHTKHMSHFYRTIYLLLILLLLLLLLFCCSRLSLTTIKDGAY